MKNLEQYKLGVVIDAKAADALKAFAQTDAAVAKLSKDFASVEGASGKSAKGIGAAWKSLFGKSTFQTLNLSGKQAFAQLEKDAAAHSGRIKKLLSFGASGGGGIGAAGLGAIAGIASGGTGFLLSAVTGGLGALAGGFKDAAVQGLDFNATLESAGISLKRMLGSSEAATQHIRDLQKAAAESPSSFESLLELDQLLINAGVAAKGLPKLLADVAVGVGQIAGTKGLDERLSRVAVQIAQMSSLGQVQNEDLKILQENMIPAYDLLAKTLGKTTKQVKELAAAGSLDGRAVGEILLRSLADVGQKAGDEVRKSYAVLRSNIDDAQQQLYAKGTQQLFQGTKDLMGVLLENTAIADKAAASLDNATGAAINFAKGAATKLASGDLSAIGGAMVSGVVEGVTNGAKSLWDAGANAAGNVVKGFKDAAGIKSPSVVMQEEGKMLPLGVAAGITDPAALAAIERAVGAMMVLVENKTAEGIARTRKRIAEGLARIPEVQAMLATIGKSEGAGYSTKVGGGTSSSVTTGQKDRSIVNLGRGLRSSADGRYQFLNKTWDAVAGQLGLTDFSAQSQDVAAIQLMRQRGMLTPLLRGDTAAALTAGNREWASLPGSPYGQHTNSSSKLTAFFNSVLGKTSAPAARPAMPALSIAERAALYNPGAAVSSSVVDDPGRTAATQIIGLSESRPMGVTITDNQPLKVDISAVAGGQVPLASAMAGVGIDGSKLTAARAELFGIEGRAPIDGSARPGTNEQLKSRALKPSLFGAQTDIPIDMAIGQVPSKIQTAMAGLKQAGKEAKDLMKDGFGQFAQGLGNILETFILTGETGPQAMRKLAAGVLASLSAQAAVKAIFYTAEGIAAATNPFTAYMAPGYFTAAAVMAGIAGGAAIAGRAVASGIRKDNQQDAGAYNQQATSESYAGNNFRYGSTATTSGMSQAAYQETGNWRVAEAVEKLAQKIQATDGKRMVLTTIKENVREIGRATVDAVNSDFGLGSRLGQRVAA